MKRRGFTLLELLIVVGLIALLSGLLVMGVDKMRASSKRQQTALTLVSLQAIYAEYDATLHRHFPSYRDPVNVGAAYPPNADMPSPQNVSSDYFNSLPTPLTQTQAATLRNGYAVLFTRDFMSQFKQMPTNSTALGKLAAGSLMTFQQPSLITPSAYTLGNSYKMLDRVYQNTTDPTNPANTITTFYTCIQYNPATPVSAIAPPDPNYWIVSTAYNATASLADNTTSVPLDAWGNPIIFVSGGSLGAAIGTFVLNADGTVPAGVGAGYGGMASGSGAASVKIQARSPDGRPFFASAGPDGDFSKADDNMYSFDR